jgi:hypothetical protein
MTDNILQVLDRIEAQRAQRDAAEVEPRSALDYLQDVYKGRRIADPWRFRAAVAALQFESPRLGVIATTSINERDFAALLDRAIERSNGVRVMKALPQPD